MTTAQVEDEANKGNLATADFNIGMELRANVLPDFLLDIDSQVGEASWRKAVGTIAITANNRGPYALPSDFSHCDLMVAQASPSTNYPSLHEIRYIGDRDDLILAPEYATSVVDVPSGFYTLVDVTDGSLDCYFNVKPAADYTARFSYRRKIPYSDTTTSIDLIKYIPAELHWLLVLKLRAAIFLDRFGEGDNRYQAPLKDYERRLSRYANSLLPHTGNSRRHVYVR